MNEEQLKFFCKWAIQNSNRPLTDAEKELLKKAVDNAKSIEDLLSVAVAAMLAN